MSLIFTPGCADTVQVSSKVMFEYVRNVTCSHAFWICSNVILCLRTELYSTMEQFFLLELFYSASEYCELMFLVYILHTGTNKGQLYSTMA